ncbi:MAG: hypothetical protein HC780_13455 [Leptolyngbyaceae cyanobacterium CSU_1_3]|nr:hypothetical protein [Leptolyngbyaceae cyanobacterium CSU_1_3]
MGIFKQSWQRSRFCLHATSYLARHNGLQSIALSRPNDLQHSMATCLTRGRSPCNSKMELKRWDDRSME